jgi:hypothetical protein
VWVGVHTDNARIWGRMGWCSKAARHRTAGRILVVVGKSCTGMWALLSHCVLCPWWLRPLWLYSAPCLYMHYNLTRCGQQLHEHEPVHA